MTQPLPAQPGFGMGTDVAGMEKWLDGEMPGWRETFGSDLPDGIDLRPAVIRTRAWIKAMVDMAGSGRLTVSNITAEQAVAWALEAVRAQLSGPTMLGA